MFVIEGALRHCEFEVEPGTINCATRPAAVSGGPPTDAAALDRARRPGRSRRCSRPRRDEALRSEVQSCMGVLALPDQRDPGRRPARQPRTARSCSTRSARRSSALLLARRAGHRRLAVGPAVDDAERRGQRALLPDALPVAEGAGRTPAAPAGSAAATAAEGAFVPHKTDAHQPGHDHEPRSPCPGPGLFGGYPTSTNSYRAGQGRRRARRSMARTGPHADRPRRARRRDRLGAGQVVRPLRRRPTTCGLRWAGAGGYGDPLERDPGDRRATTSPPAGSPRTGRARPTASCSARATRWPSTRRRPRPGARRSRPSAWPRARRGTSERGRRRSTPAATARVSEYVDVRDGRFAPRRRRPRAGRRQLQGSAR